MELDEKNLKHTENTEEKKKSAKTVSFQAFSISGPLPPPNWLKQYEEIHPGLAERIVAMSEKQSRHRRNIEKRVIEYEISSKKRGQWLAFTIAIFLIVAALLAAIIDAEKLAIALATTTIIGLVAAFLGINIIKALFSNNDKNPIDNED